MSRPFQAQGCVPPSVAAVFRLAALLRFVAALHLAAPLRRGAAFLLAAAFRFAKAVIILLLAGACQDVWQLQSGNARQLENIMACTDVYYYGALAVLVQAYTIAVIRQSCVTAVNCPREDACDN